MGTRRITTVDLNNLRRHLQEKAPTCVHQSAGLLQHTFVIPTYEGIAGGSDHADVPARSETGSYLEMYDWDSAFFSRCAHKAGIDGLPLAVVRNFLGHQGEAGFIPRTISPQRIWDSTDLCKPFLCQTLLHEMERTAWTALDQVAPLLDKLARHLNYFRSRRFNDAFGLYFWLNVLESGVDDNYALFAPHEAARDEDQSRVNYPDGRLSACDLNAYMVAELRAFGRLASRCGREDYASRFAEQAEVLVSKIEQWLWSDELGMYVNIDPADGKAVKLRSWTGLAPVLFAVASEERVQRVLKENVLNERHFLRPYGIASMAASENLSNQAPRGLYGRAIVCNWNGPVWILPNVLVVRTLLKYGMRKEASDISRRVLAAMAKDLKETGMLHENYNADTGTSLWAPRFMSWNIMALELIDLVASNRHAA